MGTLSIGLTGSGVVNGQREYTISDEHVTRLITAYRNELNMQDATDAQVLAAWVDQFIRGSKERVRAYETRQIPPPSEIDMTPT